MAVERCYTHTHTQAEEERDYRDWLKENEGNKDLHGLRTFWGNPLLDTGEQFLRDYIIKGGHRDDTQLTVPTYEEVVGVASDNEDEEALQEQEEFERRFNFRYEEPESDLVSYCVQPGLLYYAFISPVSLNRIVLIMHLVDFSFPRSLNRIRHSD